MCFCISHKNSRWSQKWNKNDIWQKVLDDSAYTLLAQNFIEITLSRTVFKINVFYAEIQDGRQKWCENAF